ncbi:thymocyte nuclear protein 1-like [Dysidea avara]|uniref:thymocyte nuclear protein 1-like n=1 Tax=Dysidea avara TaxID=196820 RepID=UPI00332E8559
MPPKKRKTAASKEDKGRTKKAKVSGDSTSDETDAAVISGAQYWLMKSEPESRMVGGVDVKFSIDDLQQEPDQTAFWDGVRNYQARNIMRDQMKVGNKAFFYHSNCKEPGIAGIVEIVREGYVDHTQFDRKDPHYDGTSKKDNPKWFMVDVKFVRMLKRFIPLSELKKIHSKHVAEGNGALKTMSLFTRTRLSVQPVTQEEFSFIVELEDEKP